MVSKDIFMFIDETGTDEKSNILAIACITTHDPDYLRSKLENLRKKLLKDPIRLTLTSVKDSLSKKGFHYCADDTTEVRPHVINLISQLPFQAYICYQEKESDFDPSKGYGWYDKLFGRLIFERLRASYDVPIHICFEQHDSRFEARRNELEKIINQQVGEIQLRDQVKFVISPKIISAGKDEPCLVIADYVAAIFKDYVVSEVNNFGSSWQGRNFERIRTKIRWIHEYGTKNFFTRKNPLP
ncbi:DUF3800 domain-containing protein [Sphaerospermopsis kisseleviana CS-549]|uniref:DUF3800 domain-containing protein n=1 Tax=Sphaerospermopsis kisseleviana CS-549 TaxID=3021783 RepID=A0ABT4ZTZ8_9CYAN|nr:MULTISPECIES: DUF3800 domain-containing protein [Sphaerospermopsis]MBD2145461.1 DUF3800 domain-containing protein [Sphaerospermopsis sp. FACHB-1194]MDB9442192.1 DUF3800 domain-containing protein [Sphaerospermopsis kisseleviana CS-549]BAZ79212.1 hypothetical protein NIES73_04520 [Sphaerospermopsis kisseleviana NIES-73]